MGQRTQGERVKLRVERQSARCPVPEGSLAAWRLGVRFRLKANLPCHQMWLRHSAGSRQGAKPQRFCSEVVVARELKG